MTLNGVPFDNLDGNLFRIDFTKLDLAPGIPQDKFLHVQAYGVSLSNGEVEAHMPGGNKLIPGFSIMVEIEYTPISGGEA
jgi:hypothetical protein